MAVLIHLVIKLVDIRRDAALLDVAANIGRAIMPSVIRQKRHEIGVCVAMEFICLAVWVRTRLSH